ncbi:MAG: hypothetical protein JWO38_3687 [Gemmataceae bacterium]|nr:hypothetical protein [Gemmataceae bacterium]
MPDPNRPRRPDPDPDPGFEVVEDPPPGMVKPTPPPPLKARRAEPAADEEGEREPGPRTFKRKKKKRRPVPAADEDQEARDRALAQFEWVWPALLLAVGLILCFVGAIGVGGKAAAFHTIGVLVIGLFVTVPVTIAALMVVGMLVGIEYGRLGPAILKIAAITFVVNGIMFIGDWAKLPGFLIFPISCLVSFGLFMTQFDLDVWETNTSVGAVNVLSFVANIILVGFLVVAEIRKDRKEDHDDSPDPADTGPAPRPNRGNQQPLAPAAQEPDDQ